MTIRTRCRTLLLATLALLAARPVTIGQPTWPATEPPETLREDIVEQVHGTAVPDPYRWLEALESQEVVRWSRSQDRVARELMRSLPGRDAIRRRTQAIMPDERAFPAQRHGELYVYAKVVRRQGSSLRALVARDDDSEAERILVDAAEHGPDARFATYPGTGTPAFALSPDGRRLAYGIVQGNSRWSVWRIRDLRSGQDLPDRLRGVHGSAPVVLWGADSDSLVYAAYDPPPDGDSPERAALRNHRVRRHRLGGDPSDDQVLFARPERPALSYWVWLTSDRRTAVALGSEESERWVSVHRLDDPEAEPRDLVVGSDDTFALAGGEGDRLWLRTTRGAPRGRLVEVSQENPERPWREILPEDPRATLTGVWYLGQRFLAQYTRDALPELRIFEPSGKEVGQVRLPYHGWIRSGFVGRPDDPRATFALQGTGEPDTVYELDMRTGETRAVLAADPPFDRDAFVSRQIFYRSADGTRVPMTLMHRKDLTRDGRAAAWLYAYGANWSAVPWYSPRFRLWLEMGGVYAFPNIRGGSEYGDSWRLAGSGVHKQNGIDDYVAAAEWLLEHDYASRGSLVANGGSASGPVAAAALLQRPELFGAAAIDYPVLDLIRYHRFAAGATAGNWGTAENPEEFEALLRWSPLHNVRPGTCYPPTILSQGNDDRAASPLHSYKFTAALQWAQTCDSPVLLQVAWGHGHTVGGADEIANQLAFLAHATGLEVPDGW